MKKIISLFIILFTFLQINAKTFILTTLSETVLSTYIDTANFLPGADTILFDISLRGGEINVVTGLSTLTSPNGDGTFINGDINNDGKPDIRITSLASAPAGIDINAASCTIQGLTIGLFTNGIQIGANGKLNLIRRCHIGVDSSGTISNGNALEGIVLLAGSSNNRIGDGTVLGRNIISGNGASGIRMTGADSNKVVGNLIGTDISGKKSILNARGILINGGSSGNVIGGNSVLERNIISGNSNEGVFLNYAKGTTVLGNYIGTHMSGDSALGNSTGIYIAGVSSNTLIGNGSIGGGNLISGNRGSGIQIGEASSITSTNTNILGNIIGLNKSGTAKLGNLGVGLYLISSVNDVKIGGSSALERNIISGNILSGIYLDVTSSPQVSNVIISGNYIGTDITGMIGFGNGNEGIFINGDSLSTGNIIGGTSPTQGNIISDNGSSGIILTALTTSVPTELLVKISNNIIGLGVDNITPLGNASAGVEIRGNASNNTVSMNNIANNVSAGVEVFAPTSIRNFISKNSIHDNTGIGISLTLGGNGNIPAPTVDSIAVDGTIYGTAIPNANIEVYQDAGFEGEIYIDSTSADGLGNWSLPTSALVLNLNITAIQDTMGNTSPFSSPFLGYALKGSVFSGSTADTVKSAKVILYGYKTTVGAFVKADTTSVNNFGIFSFSGLLPSNYLIYAVPDSSLYPNTLSTYFGDEIRWFDADTITMLNNLTNKDIICVQASSNLGINTIQGRVEEGQGFGKVQGPGDPFNGIDVSLIDKSTGNAIAQTTTDNNTTVGVGAAFSFNNIPDGSYLIHVELSGIPIDTSVIFIVNSENSAVSNVIAVVDSNFISFNIASSVAQINSNLKLDWQIYPNPIKDMLNIEFVLEEQGKLTFEIFDILGKRIESTNWGRYDKGVYIKKITLNETMSNGVYFVKLSINDKAFERKIIKINNIVK